ncbi:hypothetical protein GCM10010211_58430 [Streptomyces albospinus]|uniref:Uncharacterized protein n=1 Tax=Streptomyces albospinus TaxID=285515 RepID=A0ABQ2VG92_9ACTN|nr:hypothetical protein [Streptomyces albospinus]GGU84749.1 hypothetical protein GCM10010211_58430 [Streptomyces albospinus]
MTNMPGRLALRAYPPSFRERYGPELEALVEDTGAGPRVVADLLFSALRAWLRPVMPDESAEQRRRRMQASVATTWASWCAALYALPLLHIVLTDHLRPASANWVRPLLYVAQYAVYSSGLIPLLGALLLVAETSRSGNWAVWRPLAAAAALLPVGTLGMCALALRYLFDEPSSRLWDLGWLGLAVFLIAVAVAPPAVVTRCRPSAKILRLLAPLGVAMAFAVTATGVASVAAATALIMDSGDASDGLNTPSVIAALTAAASLAALVSSGKGARAALRRERPVDLVGDV